ncbi:MAG: hypothetical protein NZ601_05165 [candidate division WOR-3 bacterium]|nr:hypothetical protein [candidate division WOR-3 bacterium]MCX7757903.1 hypothetical protein [candidate division WOR-3 bacterium]MDW7987358.1 hypothetical protein [candidate division WOR-3 bacterium]
MAKKKTWTFRVAKINILKSIARRPGGVYRTTKVHKSKLIYSRAQAKQELHKIRSSYQDDAN